MNQMKKIVIELNIMGIPPRNQKKKIITCYYNQRETEPYSSVPH